MFKSKRNTITNAIPQAVTGITQKIKWWWSTLLFHDDFLLDIEAILLG
jgi:hypothetical protein